MRETAGDLLTVVLIAQLQNLGDEKMRRRPGPKQLAKAHAAFRAAVIGYITAKGASKVDRFYEYEIETPAGVLGISLWNNAIMTRFENVELGKRFSGSVGCCCNPYSGKWNFHFSNDLADLKPESVLAEFGFYFERLLTWLPAA